jgi:Uma2 family endonuclease
MNARSKPSVFAPVDKAAFLRFIATEPEGRYEFEGGRIVQQMTGTFAHYRLAARFRNLFEARLDPARWVVFTDWGVETAETIRYGDVVVSPADEPPSVRWTSRPAIVVEILSPSSIARDLNRKPPENLALASLQAYVVASQTEPACLAWVRGTDGAFPATAVEFGAGETIVAPSLGVSIAIDDVYRGIDLPPADGAPPA